MFYLFVSEKKRWYKGRNKSKKEGHQQANVVLCAVYEKQEHDTQYTEQITLHLYKWDKRRIRCISAEENSNGYFRELKSFANIYFHFFSNVIISIWTMNIYVCV